MSATSAQPSGGCIFCGGLPLTKEHLWPNWLRKEMQIREPHKFRIEQEHDGVETRDRIFLEPPFNQQVKAVCGKCNGGWMANIEVAAKPILQRLVRAQGMRLTPSAQHALARWGFLKACVFDEVHPDERVVPASHRHEFYINKDLPADGVWIRLATYDAEQVGHYAYQGIDLPDGSGRISPEPTVYFVTITIGALVVHVAGSLISSLRFDHVPFPPEMNIVRIWPTGGPFDFDQHRLMTHDTLVGFTKVMYNVVSRLYGGLPPAR